MKIVVVKIVLCEIWHYMVLTGATTVATVLCSCAKLRCPPPQKKFFCQWHFQIGSRKNDHSVVAPLNYLLQSIITSIITWRKESLHSVGRPGRVTTIFSTHGKFLPRFESFNSYTVFLLGRWSTYAPLSSEKKKVSLQCHSYLAPQFGLTLLLPNRTAGIP